MQTFLPYESFKRSARILDYRRLGKQRVEALQILRCLVVESGRWRSHPAVLMWEGYERYLKEYGLEICREWLRRDFKDTVFGKISDIEVSSGEKPWWLGNEDFHKSHRSNLLRKDRKHYERFFSAEEDNLEYWWPTKENGK